MIIVEEGSPDETSSKQTKVKIALLQAATRKLDLEHNVSKLDRLAARARKKGAQIACTPECMLDGYSFNDPAFQANPEQYCVDIDGSRHAEACSAIASRLSMYLIVGMSIIEQGTQARYRNAAVLFAPDGSVAGKFFKVHSTFNDTEAKFYAHGEGFPVFDVQLGDVATRIGIMICYDRQMPEAARALRVNGAEIIFTPSATNNYIAGWNTRLMQTRAYENKCFVVAVNHGLPRLVGRSLVTGPRGEIAARCMFWETARVVTIDLGRVRERNNNVRTRRPSTYQDLLKPSP